MDNLSIEECRSKIRSCSHGKDCLECKHLRKVIYNIQRKERRQRTNYQEDKCECNKRKIVCKKCSDPMKVSVRNMIRSSKQSDKKNERYNHTEFIDKDFINDLIKNNQNCMYCGNEMNFNIRNPLLCTIERIDNSIGHIKSNCVLCCFSCNVKRVGNAYWPNFNKFENKKISSAYNKISSGIHSLVL